MDERWIPTLKRALELMLRTSKDFDLVRAFVQQHQEATLLPENLARLQERLRSRGTKVDERILRMVITEELQGLEEQTFRRQVLYNAPVTREQIFENYLRSGSQRPDLLRKVLKERGHLCFRLEEELAEYRRTSTAARIQVCLTSPYRAPDVHPVDFFHHATFWRFGEALYRCMGYDAHCTKMSHDDGGDLVADGYGEKLAIQVTHAAYLVRRKVGKDKVQEVVGSLRVYGADRGVVLTNAYFSNGAKRLSQKNSVQLIGRDELNALINEFLGSLFPWLVGRPEHKVIGNAVLIPKKGIKDLGLVSLRLIDTTEDGRQG